MSRLAAFWASQRGSTLLWLTVTLAAFALAEAVSRRLRRHPLAHPVVLSCALIGGTLRLTGTPYGVYFEAVKALHFLLGPATVALAIPLWRNLPHVRRALRPLGLALVAGSLTAIGSAVGVAWLLGSPGPVLASLAPRSATSPVALEVSRSLGGLPDLTVTLVLVTGAIGAMALSPLMRALGVRDPAAQGLAAGVAAHGFGTARAFQVHPLAGTYAGVGMGLNAALTALLLSLVALATR